MNLTGIQYFPWEDLYYWNIELANVIKPIHVKGQLKLFTAIIVAVFLSVPYLRDQSKTSFARLRKKGGNSNA